MQVRERRARSQHVVNNKFLWTYEFFFRRISNTHTEKRAKLETISLIKMKFFLHSDVISCLTAVSADQEADTTEDENWSYDD